MDCDRNANDRQYLRISRRSWLLCDYFQLLPKILMNADEHVGREHCDLKHIINDKVTIVKLLLLPYMVHHY